MTPPSEVIYQLLLDLELCAQSEDSGNWQGFISFLPEDPDEAICVYDTAGTTDGRIMSSGEKIIHPGFQIRVRGPVYHDTWNKANEIASLLDLQRRISVAIGSDTIYLVHNISRTGDILPVGVEVHGDTRRHHFTINAIVTLESDEDAVRETEDGEDRTTEEDDFRNLE